MQKTTLPAANTSPIDNALLSALEHHQAGRITQAEALYRQILQSVPSHPDALHLLGLIVGQAGEHQTAINLIGRAINVNPSNPLYYNNLGMALKNAGDLDEAIVNFNKALALKPDFAEAYNNLGTIFDDQGRQDESVACYRKALALKPGYAEAYSNLGFALQNQSKLDDAVASYNMALALKPDYAKAYFNLGGALMTQGKFDAAIESYHKALACKPDYADVYASILFAHSYHVLLPHHAYLALARGWEQAFVPAQDRQAARNKVFQRVPLDGRRLRVGYVSGDFRQHSMSYFVEQLFTCHDRSQIELFAYSNLAIRDTVTERLQALAEHWVSLVDVSDAKAQERIEADRIDVLVDLTGHTAYGRLGVFARRAAPVQTHYLGFFASTGLTEMDYWIGDEILTPPEMDSHFSERVWRLPRVWVSYDGKAEATLPDWRPSQDDTVWLGSFNNLAKLTPATLALWAQVLHALPEGKLLLKTKELTDAGNRQRILDTMASHGISPDRIELQDRSVTPDWPSHMAYYNRLDIALDPVGGVGGGTTTCDALWMGVPVVTLEGDRMASRMSSSMLNAIGYPEWVARSEAEYIGKVVTLARDVERRKELRHLQRSQMERSPLCDAQSLVMSLESAYHKMFERWLGIQSDLQPALP